LASTDTPIGEVGGLLPNVSVTIDHAAHRLRNVRPAALALVPAGCRCDGLINELSGQTEEFDIRLFLVGSRAGDPQLADLLQSATRGRTAAVDDTAGVLVRTYRPVGVTLVLVRADGVVTRVARHVAITARFEPDLSRLVY
jgi:hypothetical protein